MGGFPDSVRRGEPPRTNWRGSARPISHASASRPPARRASSTSCRPHFLNLGLIPASSCRGRQIVHSRRNAVDTCLSCFSKSFSGSNLPFAYDQSELGRYYCDYDALMNYWRAILPATHFLEVEYEAVVDDLESEARRMIAFLGLPWDSACLAFHRTLRPVRTASVNQVRKPIYRGSVGRWRAHAAQLAPLLEALGVEA